LAVQLPLLAVLFAMLAGLARISEMPLRWREWDRRLGELSYPLYIGHGATLTALAGFSTRRGALPYCAAIGLSLLLAWMLHAAVEKPLRGLRTRLRGAWI
jgi:peptidoglycan/LPS O-acetylase OafA/YrhL